MLINYNLTLFRLLADSLSTKITAHHLITKEEGNIFFKQYLNLGMPYKIFIQKLAQITLLSSNKNHVK
ncbi:hypothetical protein KU06062659_900030 [Flavobacterium psychrophilum]|nr:hypothetical protein FI070_180048 [Flavobacterium psychrophilum]SNA79614.1 hypothetical protein DK095_490082 [Flavobacterium psychrophilum]SNB15734.1 hypothetical protein KU05112810_610023 [Flavobacterium psychrophilum]SNB17489.1 hypothetical protein KU06112801_570023 [Flavobacterium psychrophilum]SNB17590.1 hypothetical protein JIP1600_2930004 [Flavobacterium psychrophilum]